MSILVGRGRTEVKVEQSRTRKTQRPVSTFSEVLKGGAQVLLAGAEMATGMVGGSILSAAISRARSRLLGNGQGQGGSSGSGTNTDGTSGNSEFDAMRKLQEESKKDNLFFLELQQKMQKENRKYTTVSNILKAKHDTARAAINNIRT